MKVFRATRTNSKAADPFAAHHMSGDTRKQRLQRLLRVSVVLWFVLGSRILIAQERLKASYEAAQELLQRTKLPERIALVEKALALRARELFSRLGEANINIDYAYCGVDPSTNTPLLIVGVGEAEHAAAILDRTSFAA